MAFNIVWNTIFDLGPLRSEKLGQAYKHINDVRRGVQERVMREHEFDISDNATQGAHKLGSARSFFQAALPNVVEQTTLIPNTTDLITGRLFINSATRRMYVQTMVNAATAGWLELAYHQMGGYSDDVLVNTPSYTVTLYSATANNGVTTLHRKSHQDTVGHTVTVDNEILSCWRAQGNTGAAFANGGSLIFAQEGAAGAVVPTRLDLELSTDSVTAVSHRWNFGTYEVIGVNAPAGFAVTTHQVASGGPLLVTQHSRGASESALGVTVDGDSLGAWVGRGANTSAFLEGGRFEFTQVGALGANLPVARLTLSLSDGDLSRESATWNPGSQRVSLFTADVNSGAALDLAKRTVSGANVAALVNTSSAEVLGELRAFGQLSGVPVLAGKAAWVQSGVVATAPLSDFVLYSGDGANMVEVFRAGANGIVTASVTFANNAAHVALAGINLKAPTVADARASLLGSFSSFTGTEAESVSANCPNTGVAGERWWNLATFGDANRVTQFAQQAYIGQGLANSHLWVHHKHDATWSPWLRLMTSEDMSAEVNARNVAVSAVSAAVTAEANSRAAAVSAEANSRAAAVTAEANSRAAADTSLSDYVTSLKNGVVSMILRINNVASLPTADSASVGRLYYFVDTSGNPEEDLTGFYACAFCYVGNPPDMVKTYHWVKLG